MKLSIATPCPQQNGAGAGRLKYFLWLIALFFAVSATLLSIFFTSAATATGSSPYYAISFSTNMSTGILGPREQRWFKVTANPHGETFQATDFSLFFMGDGAEHVNFELYANEEISAWQRGDKAGLSNFGAGTAVSRDGDPRVGERIWHGVLLRNQLYFLAIENGSDVVIDYWLYNQDLIGLPAETMAEQVAIADSGPPANSAPATAAVMMPDVVPPSSPQSALPIMAERVQGRLAPGQESWYSFAIDNDPSQAFEPAAFTMITTPNDTNQAERVTFELFTAEGIRNWSVSSPETVTNVGAGSIVQRDSNPLTAERFWSGWVVSGELYYLRIRNGADIPVDTWLFNADVYGPELGSP